MSSSAPRWKSFFSRQLAGFAAGIGLLLAVLVLGVGAHVAGAGLPTPVPTQGTSEAAPAPRLDVYGQAGRGVPIRVMSSDIDLDTSVVPVTADQPTRGLIRRSAPIGWLVESAAPGARAGAVVLIVPAAAFEGSPDWSAVREFALDSETGIRLSYRTDASHSGAAIKAAGVVVLTCPRGVSTLDECDRVLRAAAVERTSSPWRG